MKRRKDDVGGFYFNEMDISQALRGWSFEPGQVNVRLIRGNDGKPKLQLRLDLGLLQMELEGRPDGKRPHRSPTELAFHQKKLEAYRKRKGSDEGFALTPTDCQALREESAMFYHRYLSLFVLEQYEAVIRDTQHNLDVLEMCGRYGKSDYDRMCLEQYRPYILMMNMRAKASQALKAGYVQTAAAYLRGGVRQIAHLAPREHRREFLRSCNEARILLDMLRQIRRQLPADPREALRRRMAQAVKAERYEEAARLRDELGELLKAPAHGAGAAGGAAPAARPALTARQPRARKESSE
jgi:hypothetical protein